MNFVMLFIVVLFLVVQNFSRVEGSCKTILFKTKYTGKALVTFVFKTSKVGDERHCRSQCFIDDRCLSCNYIPDVNTCELSESDHVMHPESLEARQGGLYFSIENECKCNKTELCRYNFTSHTFRCECNWNHPAAKCTPVCETAANNCHQKAVCTGRLNHFNCTCKTGFYGDGVNQCDDVDECGTNTHNCSQNAECNNTIGAFTCKCRDGFQGDGVNCLHNWCVCHSKANCTNTIGSYQCHCKQGFTGDGKTCADVDECATNTYNCRSNAVCANTVGSFECNCKPGYNEDGSGNCVDVDECTTGEVGCHALANCTNTIGSYQCLCKQGYTGNGKTCADVDECATNTYNCRSNAVCANTVGSYECNCKPGYNEDGSGNCVDVDECTTGEVGCHALANCTNTIGSYQCLCKQGYTGDGKTCDDIDECNTGQASCGDNSDCTNTVGSYSCSCKTGFLQGLLGGQCTKTIAVTVISGDNPKFTVDGTEYVPTKHGFNFLPLNMDGTVLYSSSSVKGFDTKHDGATAQSGLEACIDSIPDGKIVLMAVFKTDHMPSQTIFDNIKAWLQKIGSKLQYYEVSGRTGWSLVGYKGGTKSWVTEKTLDNTLINIPALNPYAE